MTAGYDTTAVALSWFAYEMSLHPDIQERLAKEIDEQVGQVCFLQQIEFISFYIRFTELMSIHFAKLCAFCTVKYETLLRKYPGEWLS